MAAAYTATIVDHVKVSQYVSAAGLVLLLWDHILTFPQEVQLIWSAKLSVPKVLFLFNRYVVPLSMIVQSHEFSGITPYLNLTVSSLCCKIWYATSVAVGMLSIATSNFLVLLRLWAIWNRSPRLMLITLAFFVVIQIVALGLSGYVIYKMLPSVLFTPQLRICTPTVRPDFLMLWCPGIAFESMVLLATIWNALDRPRLQNKEMTKVMYRDGSLHFFGLFVLRLINLIVSVTAPMSLIFLGVFFIWSITNITLARLILNLRRVSCYHDPACNSEKDDEGLDSTEEDVEQTELPVLRRQGSIRSDPESQRKLRTP